MVAGRDEHKEVAVKIQVVKVESLKLTRWAGCKGTYCT